MRKRIFCLLAVLLLLAPTFAAAKSLDLSYFTWSKDFEALTRSQLAAFAGGDLLTPVFTNPKAVTKKNLSKLVPCELDHLEKSLFAQHQGIEYYSYAEGLKSGLYTMDISQLSGEYRKAVEAVRAERQKVNAVYTTVKSGASLDLDGDGKKESIRFQSKTSDGYVYALELTIAGKKFSAGWSIEKIGTVYAFDFDAKQKVLAFECSGESDWDSTVLVFYENKKVRSVQVAPKDSIRYNGSNLFYSVERAVPFQKAVSFAIDADRKLKYGKERTLPVQIPVRFHRYDGSAADRLTLKTVGGKTRSYAGNEPFALIALSGMGSRWDGQSGAQYAALVDRNGVALMLRARQADGMIWNSPDYAYYVEIFDGAHFIS